MRVHVYDVTLSSGRPPLVREMADALDASESIVVEALVDLSARHVLVLQPDGEILMAPPFSGVPTSFVVSTDTFSVFANCGWDALGASVMLQRPTTIAASCADCGQELRLESDGHVVRGVAPLLHFSLPVGRWWENVVFT